ncbi:MAG: class I SAM-dependent methyltransferase [Planctomycetia bacterium]|nr:class I SAM-dependent methyltransferase [Planctomycetia bacterium]
MSDFIICLPSTGEKIDLSSLDVESLYQLHYQEEKFIAQKALSFPAFSPERTEYLGRQMDFIHSLQLYRREREGSSLISFGADPKTVQMVKNRIAEKLKTQNEIVVYEAGVGSGFAVEQFSHFENIKIYGCDVFLSEKAKELGTRKNIIIKKSNILEHLATMEDESIDIFYADNVFEHFFPDEAGAIYDLVAQKMKPDAEAILIIPCGTVGPTDISGRFLPLGANAEGLHFLERSFAQNIQEFKKHGLVMKFCTCAIKKPLYFSVARKLTNWIKRKTENFWIKLPLGTSFLRKLYQIAGYHIYILEKQKPSSR